MASYNRAIIIGNVTADPDVRYLSSGKSVATIRVAVNEYYKGNKRTEFFSVVLWDKLAEVAHEYIKTGSSIFIEGRNTNREYEKDGTKRYKHEIVARVLQLLDRAPAGSNGAAAGTGAEPPYGNHFEIGDAAEGEPDQIPF